MRTIQITKYYGDESLSNIFENIGIEVSGTGTTLEQVFESSLQTICMVLENGLTDRIAELLSESHARKYILVPKIDEQKIKKIAGSAIVREVPHIKGSYCIADSRILYYFGENEQAIAVEEAKCVDPVFHLFQKEFWENATEEFIQKKIPAADATFDVDPIYGNDYMLFDESLSEQTAVEQLLETGKVFGYVNKVGTPKSTALLMLRDLQNNQAFLETTSQENISYCPELPFSVVSDGHAFYALNFDIEQYQKLPEKAHGRLFAIRLPEHFSQGSTYKFFKHKTIHELVGKDVLNIKGDKISVLSETSQSRKIETDLRLASDLEKMDEETREARLEKINKDIFQSATIAQSITYTVEIVIPAHKLQKKAAIYKDYELESKRLQEKLAELKKAAEKENGGKIVGLFKTFEKEKREKFLKKLSEADVQFSTCKAYESVCAMLNDLIREFNHKAESGEIEESLSEITNPKKAGTIAEIHPANLLKDLPRFGVLYQDGEQYEYVLREEKDLAEAIQEMGTSAKTKFYLM